MARTPALSSAILLIFILVFFSPCAFSGEFGSKGPEGDIEDWNIVQSSYATIFVDKGIDLRDVTKRINVRFARYDPLEKELFLDKYASDSEKLGGNIDIIARKAKKILDMHPQGFHVDVRVYKSDRDLHDIYEHIFKERKKRFNC